MTDLTEPHPEKERKWPQRLAKIAFFVIAFFLVIFTVMANMGGNSDTMKSAIQDYIASETGYATTVQTLNRMSFFPNISIDVDHIEMRKSANDADPVIVVGKIDIAMSFWDIMFSTGHIRKFHIDQLSALPDAILTQSVYIEQAGIQDDADQVGDTALFEGFGQIGQSTLRFQADMKAFGHGGGRSYSFPHEKPFTVALNNLGLQGTINNDGKTLHIKDVRLTMPEKVMSGDVTFSYAAPDVTHMTGNFLFNDRTDIAPDLMIDRAVRPWKTEGMVQSRTFNFADFAPGSSMIEFAKKLMIALGRDSESIWSLPASNIALDVKAAKTVQKGKDAGSLEAHITFADNQLDLGTLQVPLKAEPRAAHFKPIYGPFEQESE